MAKVKLRLDTRKGRIKSDGTYPLIISVSHRSKIRPIVLKYSLRPENWIEEEQKVIGVPNEKQITAKVRLLFSKAELFLSQYNLEIESMSILDLKTRLQAEINATNSTSQKTIQKFVAKKIHKSSILDYAQKKIERLKLSQKFGNAKAVETSINSITRFSKERDLLFAEIDQSYLKDFCAYCYSRGNTPNTISAYLRPIKTLFNEAISEGIIPPEINPFVQFKIPKSSKTKKRSLRANDIEAIRELELKPNSALSNARNCFLFMFNNMGLNFIDLVKLKKRQLYQAKFDQAGQLIEGRISYTRSKTNTDFSIRLTKESIEILNSLEINSKDDDDFIFPFGFEDSETGHKRYHQQRKRLNRKIREVAKMAGIDINITTYFARHSWATIAKRKMIPISVIGEGLGHSNSKTTEIYLDSFDSDTLDNANDSIVG